MDIIIIIVLYSVELTFSIRETYIQYTYYDYIWSSAKKEGKYYFLLFYDYAHHFINCATVLCKYKCLNVLHKTHRQNYSIIFMWVLYK